MKLFFDIGSLLLSTASPQVKCVICVGSNKAQCDSRSIVRQCQVGERCYSSGARISGTPTTSFSRGCTRFSIDDCKAYCKTVEDKLENCTYRCCDGNLCNKPGGTPSTQRLVTDIQRYSYAIWIGGALALVIVISVLTCHFVNRRKKRLREAGKRLDNAPNCQADPNLTILEQCEELPYDADWEFPVQRLTLQSVIGSGMFAEVMRAEAKGILSFTVGGKTSNAFKRRAKLGRRLNDDRLHQDSVANDCKRTTVAVKMLKADASESDCKDLATELKIMIHIGEHINIINLLGACTRTKQLMIIMEFAPHGNLLNFLRSRREIYQATWHNTANNPDIQLTLADLVSYSYQIARGMDFLSSKKCVHRDLAARNILIGEDYVMKIADFGLARDIYKSDVYVKETTGLLPVKWMAPESLLDKVYTHKTDIWSFGVVLWETQTLGCTPYPGIPSKELVEYLSEGSRMAQPEDCPLEMYSIMRDCWLLEPNQRPTFSDLVQRIERIIEKKIYGPSEAYISLFMKEDSHRVYYLEPQDNLKDASPGKTTRDAEIEMAKVKGEETGAPALPPEDYPNTSCNENSTGSRNVQSPLGEETAAKT